MSVNSLHRLDLASRQLIHPALKRGVGGGTRMPSKFPLLSGYLGGVPGYQ
jgi:hypothetical protein